MNNVSIDAIITAFEASYDGLHILDKDGNTLYINSACTRIEGITKDEAMNLNIRELVAKGIYSESVTLLVLKTKEAATIAQTTKNGNEILVTGTPLFDSNGEVDKVIVNSRDVTDLNNLKREITAKNKELEHLRLESGKFGDIIANSAAMKKVVSVSMTVSKVDSTVLITGDSGVGKGLLAKYIHDNSNRRRKPFVKIDCSSIPENLIESELFGYKKGAFTGADQSGKTGLLEIANGGTVFLDEIGEMPLTMQPKLMRAIQDLEIMPVGANTVKKINVRFISATNVNLVEKINEKKFRPDLYYRLNVVPIEIPPLSQRKEDIPLLINKMIEKINIKYGFEKNLSVDVFDLLVEYDWPGNVRQLENTIERILVSNTAKLIKREDLPSDLRNNHIHPEEILGIDGKRYKKMLADYDKQLLDSVIRSEGSIPKAARRLGIDATTIRRKIKK